MSKKPGRTNLNEHCDPRLFPLQALSQIQDSRRGPIYCGLKLLS
jgi:hypothetical protein